MNSSVALLRLRLQTFYNGCQGFQENHVIKHGMGGAHLACK